LPDLDAIIALDEWLLNPKGDPPIEGLPPSAAATNSIVVTLLREKQLNYKLSPFEVVAGWCIPAIFETHCRSPAGYIPGCTDDTIRGKFVDFAELVLLALGIKKSDGVPYERRSIEAALTKCRRRLRNR